VVGSQRRIEETSGSVQGGAQVVRRGLRPKTRPQQIHQLIANKPVMRSQRQQLDDCCRLAPTPRRLGYLVRSNADAESSQELDAQILAIVR
jgi:hypothetical protein